MTGYDPEPGACPACHEPTPSAGFLCPACAAVVASLDREEEYMHEHQDDQPPAYLGVEI